MKTKYDKEIGKLERGRIKVETRLKNLQLERKKATEPYDGEIDKVQRSLYAASQEVSTLKHKREVFIRNKELQKNKDILKKGMSFKDLVLTGNGRFSDYRYFLKSGTEVIPILDIYLDGVRSADKLRETAKKILSSDEFEHLSNAHWERYLKFSLDATVESIRKLYQAGFKFRGFGSEDAVNLRETEETMKKRRQRSIRTTKFPLTYTRMPETITVVKKED